ncbi:unnamed protein product [Rotaria sp. Silwood2]|nr:unnamed protein product [Rotaria sp. Silwood2]CAF4365616.1 unnamed protein product [Rotaria sp. Silwood2]
MTDTVDRSLNDLDQYLCIHNYLRDFYFKWSTIMHQKVKLLNLVVFDILIMIFNWVFIDEFNENYNRELAIWWNTRKYFLYAMLNRSLTTQDIEVLLKMRFFVGLPSFNNFLSTSIDPNVSIEFTTRAFSNPNVVAILFKTDIDPKISSVPFAALDNVSSYEPENEILFSMHTIFRLGKMHPINERLWQIELTLTSDNG